MMEFDLKQVFAFLDENDEGQIQLRRFVDVANNYYSDAEQLARITKALDPNNTGLINFDQFYDGITQISSLQGVSVKDVASDLSRLSRENSLAEDSDQRSLNQDGSTTTFNEYDVESDDTSHHQNNSKIIQTTNNKISGLTNNSKAINNNNRNSNQSISPTLDSSFFGAEEEFTGVAEPNFNTYSPDSIYPRPTTPQRTSQLLKRNNYLQPILPSEPTEEHLHETVDDLRKNVEVLAEQKQATSDHLLKIQSENSELKSRLVTLEELFHNLEEKQTRSTQSEQQKYAEYNNQKDRVLLQEKEILQSSVMRIDAIESELKYTQTTNGQMKKDVKQLKEKLEDVDVELNRSQIRCNDLSDDNTKLIEQLRLQRDELEAEKLTNAQLAEQLTLESSRKMFGRTLSRTESIIKSSEIRILDLDAQVRALKLENEKLKHENEELREGSVAAGYKEGMRLTSDRKTLSFAAELEVLSKDELMCKLREQFTVNDRLREYIERMLSVIIENNPQLLEVTNNSGVAIGSMSMSSTDHRKQSLTPSSKGADNNVVSPQPLQPTESIQSDSSSSTSTTPKKPNDNS